MFRYWVYFRGTGHGMYLDASSLAAAKWQFASREGLRSILWIAGKHVRRL